MNIKKVTCFLISYMSLLTVFMDRADAYVYPDTGGYFLDVIYALALGIVFLAPWLWALIDIMNNEFSGGNKAVWLLIVRLVPVLGFILYFFIGRRQKTQVNASIGQSKNS